VGATYFFSKPVRGAELVARLREWIDRSKTKMEDGRERMAKS
jgi:DNA-binding response OmpR family regulator